jgi:hypothetical protein
VRPRIGERAGAIIRANETDGMMLAGYGVYAGDFVPHDAAGWVADMIRVAIAEGEDVTGSGLLPTNPRIDLDGGEHVWGCECWWGSEEDIRKKEAFYREKGLPVVVVSMSAERAKLAKET